MDMRAFQKGLGLVLPALVFGFFVSTQWATSAAPASRDVAIRYVDPLSDTVTRLQDEQMTLKTELSGLRDKLDELQRAAATQSGAALEIAARIEDLRASAGLAEVRGEGVVVALDVMRSSVGATANVRQACLAPDLTDLANAAWRGGARAVAINGERLVASSSVYCVGPTIVVNGSIVQAPYQVSAVGPAPTILGVLDDPSQLRDLKRRRDQQTIDLRFSRAPQLALPAYTGPLIVRTATPR